MVNLYKYSIVVLAAFFLVNCGSDEENAPRTGANPEDIRTQKLFELPQKLEGRMSADKANQVAEEWAKAEPQIEITAMMEGIFKIDISSLKSNGTRSGNCTFQNVSENSVLRFDIEYKGDGLLHQDLNCPATKAKVTKISQGIFKIDFRNTILNAKEFTYSVVVIHEQEVTLKRVKGEKSAKLAMADIDDAKAKISVKTVLLPSDVAESYESVSFTGAEGEIELSESRIESVDENTPITFYLGKLLDDSGFINWWEPDMYSYLRITTFDDGFVGKALLRNTAQYLVWCKQAAWGGECPADSSQLIFDLVLATPEEEKVSTP